MKEPISTQEVFADRSADNYSPENIRCRFCRWFCPHDPTKRETYGECRASLPQEREVIGGFRRHEEVPHDHWCKHYEDDHFADKFRKLHHFSLLDLYQRKLQDIRRIAEVDAQLAAEDEH
ncbi:hypothetical protein [Xanthobacter sediminis]